MKLTCFCGKEYEKSTGHYNRAIKLNANLYCSKTCASEARRDHKSIDQKKAEKAEYDKQYRYYHREGIKAKKAEAFKKDYEANPDKYKAQRQKRYPKHLKYLQSPEYKAYKKEYDKRHLAKKQYGEFAECFLITEQIFSLIPNREIKLQMGLTNKNQNRKRQWKILMQNH